MGVSLPPLACVSLIQVGNDQCPPGQADRHDDAAPGGHGQRVASVKFLIRDRADQFTGSFDAVFTAEGIRILRSPPQAPRANAICERMIGTLRRELLDRLLIVDEHHLRRVLTEYLRHYNAARPHRALGQLTPAQADTQPPEPIDLAEHRIRRKQVLGGLTHEYYVAALQSHAATERRRSLTRIVFPSPTRCWTWGPTLTSRRFRRGPPSSRLKTRP
jgi:hypothetical protein